VNRENDIRGVTLGEVMPRKQVDKAAEEEAGARWEPREEKRRRS